MAQVTLTLAFNTVEEAQAFLSRSTSSGGNEANTTSAFSGAQVTTVVVQPVSATIGVDERTPFEKLMDELEDPRFTMRTFKALIEQTGIPSRTEIETLLRNSGVDFVVKTRRSDRAVMIGLDERN